MLIGGGHSHVIVLRSLAMQPEPGLDVTLIAKELDAPYSGMLPGYVSGHYELDACHIDLVRVAHFAGARLIHGEADGIDPVQKQVRILGRPPVSYNLLSIDTGITPALDGIEGARRHAIPVKPVSNFAPRWEALRAQALTSGGPRRIVMVGTGAAGFELVLAIRHRLRAEADRHGIDPDAFRFSLVGSGALLASHNTRARELAKRELAAANVELVVNDAVVEIGERFVLLASGRQIVSDATLLTTKAAAPRWFRDTGLPLDAQGFLAVEDTLQVRGQTDVFAVGDCASVTAYPREKAGVFAVRQGPPLTENLRRRARGMAARPFKPQTRFLTLLACGDKRAIAARGALAGGGAWAWWLKDRIDRSFMRRFKDLPALAAMGENGEFLCSGCAAKLGPASLSRALARFEAMPPHGGGVISVRNLAPNDDAALLDLGGDRPRLETIDYFPAIWPEPFVLGEIAAAHAISDIHAKGGRPDHVLALVGLPAAAPHLMEDDLFQMLAGARSALEPEGISIVGGHTARSPEMGIGFFAGGEVASAEPWLKGGLRSGQMLVLTKPLGTGIMFAGWMRRMARARDVFAAIDGMRRTNAAAARVFRALDVEGVTDITGFGVAGHLVEMLEASDLSATIWLSACQRYPGVDDLIARGVRSSLLTENMTFADRLALDGGLVDADTALALLLDPQTSGGLLAGVAAERVERVLAALHEAGLAASIVGRVEGRGPSGETGQRLRVTQSPPDAGPTGRIRVSPAPVTAQ